VARFIDVRALTCVLLGGGSQCKRVVALQSLADVAGLDSSECTSGWLPTLQAVGEQRMAYSAT
jgi:hypothetical protein